MHLHVLLVKPFALLMELQILVYTLKAIFTPKDQDRFLMILST
jgi:hypothetical protein